MTMSNVNLFDRAVLQRLYRYAYTLCKDQDNAYDLVQHALEKFLQKPASQKPDNELAYVHRIMRNRFIDEYRRSNRFPEEGYDDGSTVAMNESSLEDIVIAQADLEIIWETLDLFEREILYYWAVEEMTAQEIASLTGVPRGTVLSRIYRVRKKIETETRAGGLSGGYKV